jgi:ketoreductase RED2
VTKVALVTGGSSGIGAAVCRALASEGMTVVVNSARSVEAGQDLAADIGGSYAQGDVSIDSDARRIVDTALAAHGQLDVVVCSAGTTETIPHEDLEAVTDEIWRRILEVNLLGPWHVIRAAVPHLRVSGDGVVVNISSRAGGRPTGSSIPYAASKAALDHLTRLLANVLGPEIRVNAVAPGLIETPWTDRAGFERLRAQVEGDSPLGRVGRPEEVAAAVVGLVNARYTTGAVLVADGGAFLR